MDTKKLAELIYSVTQYNRYNTSILQIQKSLSTSRDEWQFTNKTDCYVFEGLVRATHYVSRQKKLTVDVFKGINAQVDSHEEGQSENSGKLREKVTIHAGDCIPSRTVIEKMVQRELDIVAENNVEDGWALYARLTGLQAFDNGNKRIALILANLFIGSLTGESSTYLITPTDFRRTRFGANSIYYYMADDFDDYMPDVQYSLNEFVRFARECTKTRSKDKFEERLVEAKKKQKNHTSAIESEIAKNKRKTLQKIGERYD